MIRRPPRSTLFPTRRSSDLAKGAGIAESARCAVEDAHVGLDVKHRAVLIIEGAAVDEKTAEAGQHRVRAIVEHPLQTRLTASDRETRPRRHLRHSATTHDSIS